MLSKGFTLIELLVVIAILGILAVGIVSALNPAEQINKATDTTTQSLAREFLSANNQFQTGAGYSSACPDQACATFNDSLNTVAAVPFDTLTSVNGILHNASIAPTADSFIHHPQAPNIQATLASTSQPADTTYILCWRPASRSQKSRADMNDSSTTIYNSKGVVQPSSSCPADNTNNCYQCMR